MRTAAVKCFKCEEEGHKCRECSLWKKKVKRVAYPDGGKAYQEERRPVCPIREKAQKGEKRLRRVEEGKAAHVTKLREAQQEWKRSSIEELTKRVEEHYSKGVPEEV